MSYALNKDSLTRRSALMFAATAVPLAAQSQPPAKSTGHPVVYFEIGCRDQAKTEHFFGQLFDWKIQRNGIASAIDTGSTKGVPGHISALGHEPQHYTMFYVEVDDVQAHLDKVVSLGGKTLVPPIKTPMGTFGWFSDPEGNMIGLLKRP